jgi:antitoxin HicB
MRYTVLLEWDAEASAYAVSVPALPGCVTYGPTVEVATVRAKEAIQGWIEWLIADSEPVPVEEPPLIPVVVDVEVDAQLEHLAATG